MAIINFSVADILRGKNLEKGWYSFEITNVEGPVANAKKDGVNFKVTFSLIDSGSDTDGKQIVRFYSSKAISMFIPLIAAIRGISVDDMEIKDFQLDTDELTNAKVDGAVTIDTYEGQQRNVIENFVPYKSAVGKGLQF